MEVLILYGVLLTLGLATISWVSLRDERREKADAEWQNRYAPCLD